jgi:hypothetical protein
MKIIIEVESCSDCPFLELDSYNQFRCHRYDAYIGKDIYYLERCSQCIEEVK